MEIKSKTMCANEVRKVGLLIQKASDLGWDVSGYGQADVNPNSGNTYLWLEDYPVTPYIGLGSDDEVCFLFSCGNCGHEWDVPESKVKAEVYPKRCQECKKAV